MRFRKIYIEITDICHLSCGFCTPKKGRRGVMPLPLFERIITQVAPHTKLVSLHVLGDPLCVEQLGEYIAIAGRHNVCLDIVSSGIFLHEKHFALLTQRHIHQVSFSLDSLLHNKGVNVSLDSYLERIGALYEYAREHAPHLYMNIRLFSVYDYESLFSAYLSTQSSAPTRIEAEIHNSVMLSAAKQLFLENNEIPLLSSKKDSLLRDSSLATQVQNDKLHESHFSTQNPAPAQIEVEIYESILRKFPHAQIQLDKRRVRLDRNFFLRFHKPFVWQTSMKYRANQEATQSANIPKDSVRKPYCLGAIKQLGILANGVVVPCCIDANANMPLGDFSTQDFETILHSEPMWHIQQAMSTHENLPSMCQTCTFRGV